MRGRFYELATDSTNGDQGPVPSRPDSHRELSGEIQGGKMDAAIAAYRNYMTCIPHASLEHKRDVVQAIKRLKQRQLALASVGASGAINNSMP